MLSTRDEQDREWSRYYRLPELHDIEVLHARFVDHRYARHSHDYFVIALMETGAASYWYRGSTRVAGSGYVFVVNPDEPHTGDSATVGGYIYRVLYPRSEHLRHLAADVGTREAIPYFKDSVLSDAELSFALARFHRQLADRAPSAHCEGLLLRSLARLLTHHTDPAVTPRTIGCERPAVKRASEYIQSHFTDDVSISKLASLVGLSPYYFARAFEREIGLPPHTYVENVRVQKAREFLDRGYTVVSAALAAGYADQSHLTHRFKRFLGITPGQYARESKFCVRSSGSCAQGAIF
ncbi:MAG TPA: AraC family transcriptional regulator [Terriglobales bacterium]|nr:AraC family transcriptional regulator [Terriglobales bacterium]